MVPETVTELLSWLRTNCYADTYAIGNIRIHEGYGLDHNNGTYSWYYTERGQRQDLEQFKAEKDAVAYAFNFIKADAYANRHMIGFVNTQQDLENLKSELEQRGIRYFDDVLFYSHQAPQNRYRVFVFGCDVEKVRDLEKRYDHYHYRP